MKWFLLLPLTLLVMGGVGGDSISRSFGEGVGKAVSKRGGPVHTVVIDAMPFTRTVTCTGSYTLTGTAANTPSSVSWSASPSGSSGACTGTSSWSCAVAVAPDAVGEGVETITVTATGSGTAGTDTETIGFYVNGAHSCFTAQNINGTYNSGMVNNDAITTWENIGSSAKDASQTISSTQKPTYITNCAGTQPCVRFDGGDRMYTATIADWTFMNNGTDYTMSITFKTAADPNALLILASTQSNVASVGRGMSMYYDDRVSFPAEDQIGYVLSNGTSIVINARSVDEAAYGGEWHVASAVVDDDAGALIDGVLEVDLGSVAGQAQTAGYSASTPQGQLVIGDEVSTRTFKFVGDMTSILIYQSALTDTQQRINKDVASWETGDAITSKQVFAFVGDSITAGSGGVTSYPTKIRNIVGTSGFIIQNRGVGSTRTSSHITQWRAAGRPDKLFVLGGINDIALDSASAAAVFANLTTIYQEAQNNSVGQVIGIAILPFGDAASWSVAKQAELEACNASILASVDTDFELDWYTLMQDPADLDAILPAYSQADGVHPSEDGTTVMANDADTQLGL